MVLLFLFQRIHRSFEILLENYALLRELRIKGQQCYISFVWLGTPGASYLKERFTEIDDSRHLKEVEVIEGGYKDMGFHLYRIRLEIVENGTESSVVRSTIEYDVDDKFAENASLVTTKSLETIAEVVGRYLTEKKATAQSESRSHEHHA